MSFDRGFFYVPFFLHKNTLSLPILHFVSALSVLFSLFLSISSILRITLLVFLEIVPRQSCPFFLSQNLSFFRVLPPAVLNRLLVWISSSCVSWLVGEPRSQLVLFVAAKVFPKNRNLPSLFSPSLCYNLCLLTAARVFVPFLRPPPQIRPSSHPFLKLTLVLPLKRILVPPRRHCFSLKPSPPYSELPLLFMSLVLLHLCVHRLS